MANYDLYLGDKPWNNLDANQKAELLNSISDEALQKLSHDPMCNQIFACQRALARRVAREMNPQGNPFNPRTEVSEDARYIAGHIVKHLWIIFVAFPFVVAILYEILKSF
jgi:hypothetical protein